MNLALRSQLRDESASALRAAGTYVGEIDSAQPQGHVDAQWAAHLAGRDAGIRVTVTVQESRAGDGQPRSTLHVRRRF